MTSGALKIRGLSPRAGRGTADAESERCIGVLPLVPAAANLQIRGRRYCRTGCYELALSTIWAISTKSMAGATPYRPVTRSLSSSEKKPSAASLVSQT